jgi:hypothetical protein
MHSLHNPDLRSSVVNNNEDQKCARFRTVRPNFGSGWIESPMPSFGGPRRALPHSFMCLFPSPTPGWAGISDNLTPPSRSPAIYSFHSSLTLEPANRDVGVLAIPNPA